MKAEHFPLGNRKHEPKYILHFITVISLTFFYLKYITNDV